jgi:hypothetical protein
MPHGWNERPVAELDVEHRALSDYDAALEIQRSDTPHATAASSLVSAHAIGTQNARSGSRRTGGRPGDTIAARPVNAAARPGGRPIEGTSIVEVFRRPVGPDCFRGRSCVGGDSGIHR